MEAAAAKLYMKELSKRHVGYSFEPKSHGLVTVTTPGTGKAMWDAYDALLATWSIYPPGREFTKKESEAVELDRR